MADGSKLSQTTSPSKVLHLRNLPYETTEEELRELCAPFGSLVQTKLSVGPNKNQAFVEFQELSQAVNMIQYYTSTAEPAKVRGKTVYLQYSKRQEITNARTQGDSPSNVLLVSLENLSPTVPITIDTLHIVFSAFGTVQKIATFEKSAGFQALVQYSDMATAEKVRGALDGRHIPRHLLNDTPNPPLLKITFSQHQDLNVKFQSHRSRDYTNPYLPVAPTGQDPNLAIQAPPVGAPGEGNVLLCAIENYAYPVVADALHTVFSPYGFVQKIAIFEKNSTWQALIQFSDPASAANAKHALEGHAVYDGGYNKLKITYSVHRDLNVKGNNERGWDYTVGHLGYAPPPLTPPAYGMANGVQQQYGVPPGSVVAQAQQQGAVGENGDVIVTGQDYEAAHIAVAKAMEGGGAGARPPPAYAPAQGYPGNAPPYQPSGPAPGYQPPPAGAPRPPFAAPPNPSLYQPPPGQPAYGHSAPQQQPYAPPGQGGPMNQYRGPPGPQQQQYAPPSGGGYHGGPGYPQGPQGGGRPPAGGSQPPQYGGQPNQYAPQPGYPPASQYGNPPQYNVPSSQPQAPYPGPAAGHPPPSGPSGQYAMY